MLYLITNRRLIKNGSLIDVLKESIRGGIDAIILREKDLSNEELFDIANTIKELVKNTGVSLIINGNLEVARKIKADGYHISFDEFILAKPSFRGLVGVSVHSIEEAILAEKHGASYLLAGHIFATDCKKDLLHRGLNWLNSMKAQVNLPIIALGGINHENAKSIINSGIKDIAVMSLIMSAESPYNTTKALKVIL